jgi:hypothetical protein
MVDPSLVAVAALVARSRAGGPVFSNTADRWEPVGQMAMRVMLRVVGGWGKRNSRD